MILKYCFSIVLVLCSVLMTAQNVTVNTSASVQALIDDYTEQSKQNSSVDGWRIQIITTDDRRKMETARSKFEGMHPNLYLKWEHIVPYYKIKVGAYKNKLDLQAFLKELREDFPSAIPIPDKIKKTELIWN